MTFDLIVFVLSLVTAYIIYLIYFPPHDNKHD